MASRPPARRPPAAISPEAEAFLAGEGIPNTVSMDEVPIVEIRRQSAEACRAASENAVEAHKVACSDTEIAGISCMKIAPPDGQGRRRLLYLFGGGFVQGSPFEDMPIIAPLAAKTGATVIAPHYRLAPEHPFPAALDDATAVARALLTGQPDTVVAGESAGGNLALGLVHRLRGQGHAVPRAIAVMSPAADLDHVGDSETADRDPSLPARRIDEVRKAYLGDRDARHPEISPIYGAFDPSFPSTIITTGTRDLFLSSCVRLARVMSAGGAEADLRIWEGMWHVFEYHPNIPEADASLSEVAVFLERCLG